MATKISVAHHMVASMSVAHMVANMSVAHMVASMSFTSMFVANITASRG